MKILEFCQIIDSWVPKFYAEDFDNIGLLVGDPKWMINKLLVTIDTTEEVIKEAYDLGCNFIVSFHPIIFKSLKSIIGRTASERAIMLAIKYDIAIYVIHTNLDNHPKGTNYIFCQRLGLIDSKILIPHQVGLKKLTTYIPKKYADQLREALFKAGAGHVGKYHSCSYNINGWGTFMGNDQSSPVYGKKGCINSQKEISINIIFPTHLESKILEVLFRHHPYEEIPHEIFDVHNSYLQNVGLGRIGRLQQAISEIEFLTLVKECMQTSCIRHSAFLKQPIDKVAVLGGSGSFAISIAKNRGAHVFISSDFKYHQFFKSNNEILLLDIGHYESEQFIKEFLIEFLRKKFSKFVIIPSNIRTNPVHYFY